MKIEKGDLVEVPEMKLVGLVIGTPKDWWVCKNNIDVANHLVDKKDVKIIKKNVVPKNLIKFIK